jgi:hypothetical protein
MGFASAAIAGTEIPRAITAAVIREINFFFMYNPPLINYTATGFVICSAVENINYKLILS